jgi:beta-glucosidase
MDVSVTIKNVGATHGAEVAQLYLGFPAAAGEPPQVLRGFQKLHLAAGAEATATFELGAGDLSVWDAATHEWSPVAGEFGVFVGASSRNILLKGSLTHSPVPGAKVELFQ